MRLNRRNFLSIILLFVGGGLYKEIFAGHPELNPISNHDDILREAALSLWGFVLDNPPVEQLIVLEERLLGKNWSNVKNVADFDAWVYERVTSDFLEHKTVNLNGWIVSEFERDLVIYAFLVQTSHGVLRKEDAGSFESAETVDFLTVEDWGPRSTCVGMPFNPQSDGHSSHWFSIDSYNGRLAIYIGGVAISTTKGTNVLTTKVEGATLAQLTGAAGLLDIMVYDPIRNIKQKIGIFEVFSQPPRAFTMNSKESRFFGEILEWGPKKMTISQFTGSEKMPVWIKTSCAPDSAVINLAGNILKTVVSSNFISGMFDITNEEIKSGQFDLILIDLKSGESVLVGALELTD